MNPKSEPTRTYQFEILRYDALQGGAPRFQIYTLTPARKLSVLEALLTIQNEQDPSLAFRYACRGAVCGSCAMSVNGKLSLACRVQLEDVAGDRVVLEPLPRFHILKDLVVDMEPFWQKFRRVQPWLHAEIRNAQDARMSEAARARIDQYVNCILCGLCCAACPALGANEDFTGPAALARLYRFLADSRETGRAATLEQENSQQGMWGCRTITRCIDACPKHVRPTDAITGVRRRLLREKIGSWTRRRRSRDQDQV